MPAGECRQQHLGAVPDPDEERARCDHRIAGGDSDEDDRDERQHGAGAGFETIERPEAVAPQPRPTDLPVPDVAASALAERLLERRIDQAYSAAAGAHD